MKRVEFFRHSLGAVELASVDKTLSSLFLTLGPRVGDFEARFGEMLGCPHVVGVNSCSNALVLALRAMDIGPGDEVITTPMTFVATSNAILHVGATHRFADIDPRTGLLDLASVERLVNERTKAVIVVHLYGQLADMRGFRALCDRHNLRLIEDAAHAIESERDGVRTAQLGDAACFSFYATKTITSGDGGAIALHDSDLAQRLRRLRNHGVSKDAASRHGGAYQHWDMMELGYKAAMTDIEAALLLPQLDRVAEQHAKRRALAERYHEKLCEFGGVELCHRVGLSGHHLFTVRVDPALRDAVLAGLAERSVGCAVNYRAVHTLHYYRETFGYKREDFPHAARFGASTLSLPLWHDMPPESVDIVVDALRGAIEDARA
jgi:dTDP-4-amino-4,6-dideoxygalactose transaminase